VLPPGQRGTLYFYETASGSWRREPSANVDLQKVELSEEKGEFTLVHSFAGPGYFHLYLAAPGRDSHAFANVYFGTGENVLHEKLVVSADKASQAKEQADETAESKAKEAAKAAQAAEDKQTKRLLHQFDEVAADLLKRRRENSHHAAQLELAQLQKWIIQQRLEMLNKTLIDLETSTGSDEKAEAARIERRDGVRRQMENAKREMIEFVANMAELSNTVAEQQQEVARLQRRLDELDRLKMQQELRRLMQVGWDERAVQAIHIDPVAATGQAMFQSTPMMSYPEFERGQAVRGPTDVLFYRPTPAGAPTYVSIPRDEIAKMQVELEKLKAENAALRRQAELSRPAK
jgi:hypothetical protein